uniref:ACB domain-containing protein n=1 Tax=Cyclopterus lumpus TaxID=8103 RepID=A0A8C2WPU4_CYCLU
MTTKCPFAEHFLNGFDCVPLIPSDDMLLMFYSYYKQATLGPCNIPRPNGFWDTSGKAKWYNMV